MVPLLIVIHIIICLVLVLVVLLQPGKGADLGSAFGGSSSQTAFGTRRGNILTRFTAICAVLFMITSFLLTLIYSTSPSIKKGLLGKEKPPIEEKQSR